MYKILISFLVVISFNASADIIDRINDCESRGGGSCVYTLLRELAANGGGAGGPATRPLLLIPGKYELVSGQTTNCGFQNAQVSGSVHDETLRVSWTGYQMIGRNTSYTECSNVELTCRTTDYQYATDYQTLTIYSSGSFTTNSGCSYERAR